MTTKLDLRTSLNVPVTETTTPAELFQNQTLRPILKLQNEMYLAVFSTYASRQKTDFSLLSVEKKCSFVEQSLLKDSVLKNTFIGITIGMFTPEELEMYHADHKVFNRRIITMLIERIKSQIK